MRTASSRKYNCREGVKQKALLKVSPTGGGESKGSPGFDEGLINNITALEMQYKVMKQAVAKCPKGRH